jgi:tripartite-type tricarboxylate transporter receptor subunit TctC
MRSFDLRRSARWLAWLLLTLLALSAFAQDGYPSRPIDFIVPWGPGGGSDQTARELAKLLEPELKVSVPILNVPGATGNTGMAKFLNADANGYTLCILAWDTYALLATNPPSWSVKDFVPLGIVIQLPSGFYIAGDRYHDWQDVEKEARQRPLKVAISGFGSPDEITINYLRTKGLKLDAVPFAKPGERYAALLGGHVDLLYSPAGNVKSFVDSKQMRPALFFNKTRLPEFPSVATSVERGYDITLPQRRAILVKAGTDKAKVDLLAQALKRAVATPEYKAFLKDSVALEDSFVPTKESLAVMESDLVGMKAIVQATAKSK